MFSLDYRVCTAAAPITASLIAAALLTTGAGAGTGARAVAVAPAPAERSSAPRGQPLVVLLRDHVVRTAPHAHAHRVGSVAARRPLTHVRTVLPVLARATAKGGGAWVRVRLPGRPNGHSGWISADRTRRTVTQWRISIRLSTRRVTVYHRGRVEGRFRAVVGRPSTPTPRGQFFVEESVALSQLGAPFALAISARSDVYQQFGGGPGQVALHGTTGLAGALGTAASHGCIRLSARAITWLARRIGTGTPLTIRR
jgi:lipoprotein-anchoring transpeptidase ErfK/SrfK